MGSWGMGCEVGCCIMDNMKYMKRIVLSTAFLIFIIVLVLNNPIMFGFCQKISSWGDGTEYCNHAIIEVPEGVSSTALFLSIFYLSLSLITYKMREGVFYAWFSFACWWTFVIICVAYFLSTNNGGGGYLGDLGFGIFISFIFYAVLVIVSFVKIVRTYRRLKK